MMWNKLKDMLKKTYNWFGKLIPKRCYVCQRFVLPWNRVLPYDGKIAHTFCALTMIRFDILMLECRQEKKDEEKIVDGLYEI